MGDESPPEGLHYISALEVDPTSAFWSAFHECKRTGAKLLIVDSLGIALDGDSETSKDVIGFYKKYTAAFVKEGISVLLIDHQSKLTANQSYQNKTSFGSVYKRNLVRSEIQLEATEQDEEAGTLDLLFRHKKHNFGPKAKPFGARVTFRHDRTIVEERALEENDLAKEETLNSAQRVLLAISALGKPVVAKDLELETNLAIGTIRNAITTLKRQGKVRATGDKVGQAELIEVTGLGVSTLSFARKGGEDDEDGEEERF